MFSKTWWRNVLSFRYMLLPGLIKFIFWAGLIICLGTAAVDWSHGQFWRGLSVLIVGPVLLRLACEILIILFQLNNTLFELWQIRKQESSGE